jgi:hypothetical protein
MKTITAEERPIIEYPFYYLHTPFFLIQSEAQIWIPLFSLTFCTR